MSMVIQDDDEYVDEDDSGSGRPWPVTRSSFAARRILLIAFRRVSICVESIVLLPVCNHRQDPLTRSHQSVSRSD